MYRKLIMILAIPLTGLMIVGCGSTQPDAQTPADEAQAEDCPEEAEADTETEQAKIDERCLDDERAEPPENTAEKNPNGSGGIDPTGPQPLPDNGSGGGDPIPPKD